MSQTAFGLAKQEQPWAVGKAGATWSDRSERGQGVGLLHWPRVFPELIPTGSLPWTP